MFFIKYRYQNSLNGMVHVIELFRNFSEEKGFKNQRVLFRIENKLKSEILKQYKDSDFFDQEQYLRLDEFLSKKENVILSPDSSILLYFPVI